MEDLCTLCSTKYQRTQYSLCQCKHCSQPLCFDCMKEHRDELMQSVNDLSHRYNEILESQKTKQSRIENEVKKSMEDIQQWYDECIKNLQATKSKLIEAIEHTKQKTEIGVQAVNCGLRALAEDLQILSKGNSFHIVRMETTSKQLDLLQSQLDNIKFTFEINLSSMLPINYTLKFNQTVILEEFPSSPTIVERSDVSTETSEFIEQDRSAPLNTENDEDSSKVRTASTRADVRIQKPHIIDRLASDGENILYSTDEPKRPNFIVYAFLDINNGKDFFREWNQKHIEDMIWWSTIRKFLCATDDAIYTVDCANKSFKIVPVLRVNCSYVRVAANTAHLWVWMNCTDNRFNGIRIYSTNFAAVQEIDFTLTHVGSLHTQSHSFCVTDQLMTSIYKRQQFNREVFQVKFYTLNMKEMNTVLLGACKGNTEIRSDGNDRFFISSGKKSLHIVSSNGSKRTVELKENSGSIAVLDNQKLATSNFRRDLEIISY